MLSHFLFGFLSGSLTSIIAGLSIFLRNPFSAFKKFLAEFSTMIGVYLVLRSRRPTNNQWKTLSMISGISVRVIVMAFANIILLPIFMPSIYQTHTAVIVLVPLLSVFNAVQGALSVLGGFLLYEGILLRLPSLKMR